VLAVGAVLVVRLWPSPPEIPSPDLPARQAAACRALHAALPDTLLDEPSTEITGAREYGAAWGDPAIVLTCGVGAVDLADAPPCTVVNGIGWVTQQQDDSTVFTADGYRPRVRVVVPDDYAPEAGALTELAALMKEHTVREVKCL
jgi:hypothetical protein